jgi:hypothetical protein
MEIIRNDRELVNELGLYGIAYAGSAAQNIEGLRKRAHVVYGEIGAVVRRHVIPRQSLASRHKCPHRGQNLLIQDGQPKLLVLTVRKSPTTNQRLPVHVVHIAIYGLFPGLASSLFVIPPSVFRLVHVLLVGCF